MESEYPADETVTDKTIADAFKAETDNYAYALQINGNILTGYASEVTPTDQASSADATSLTADDVKYNTEELSSDKYLSVKQSLLNLTELKHTMLI